MERGDAAFTLVELLTVIAVIGILAAILVPAATSVRTAAKKAKTRGQFSQWGAAVEAFRQEYGMYPLFETSGAGQNKVNGNTAGGSDLAAPHRFYETLVGARRDGSALPTALTGDPPPPQAQNTRRISFITFTDADLVPLHAADPVLAGKQGLIRDAFDNTDIVVLVDHNLDGAIKVGTTGGDQVASLPAVAPPDSPRRIPVNQAGANPDFPSVAQGGVRRGVVFYCAPPQATSSADLILSWK